MVLHWLSHWFDALARMVGGRGHLRYVFQPLVAVLLGVRDGRLDARAHTPPWLWQLLFEPAARKASWLSGVRALTKPFLIATAIDCVMQYLILRNVHLGYALLTGCLFVGLPYALVRAGTNRVLTHDYHWPPHKEHERTAGGATTEVPA
jgi:hypothetical protein